ncbi:chemotaxis protein CheD [Stakelama sp. CBK3Z-3]|uniref:Probable chemoreceptor glutamine deamidase CheD n=1 Tax=Stakelama flava TaxID=2860338 RepID=A0ABS6XJU3_9SPHN|nr:chemotaxis protein CheD [Stakelama flava]MBW4330426.1 chemotaxis protein CheD [Stakelama flava]
MRTIPIIQGEHAVVKDADTVISTLLGSCIAVCLHDAEARLGGMNHFLLGEPSPEHTLSELDLQRYGVHAMEVLINATMKAGANRQNLRAHLYGGANIIAGLGGIGTANAAFAKRFLETEGIAIGHVDTGGTRARKVEFRPFDGKIRARCVSDAPPPPKPDPTPEHGGEIELF